jgi:hypothetical protein
MDFEPGRFPFGRPNTQRPMRRPDGSAKALVVGVYPSAFHVRWDPPAGVTTSGIASLAVDVEPVVLWDGKEPNPSELVATWAAAVGFDPGRHGQVSPGKNGPSGDGLVQDTLVPLGVAPDEVAFTDAVPWFFVKTGLKDQGTAIRERFAPVAVSRGCHPGSLPSRPSTKALVELARSDLRRDSLRAELLEADAPLVITLGQEALDAVRAVTEVAGGQEKLAPEGYGALGRLELDGHSMELLPLAHPGLQRQISHAGWREAFARWRDSLA